MNPRFNAQAPKQGGTVTPPMSGKALSAAVPEKKVGWGDLPGKTQPGDRSAGVKKVVAYPDAKGL